MTNSKLWLLLIMIGFGTFLLRLSFIHFLSDRKVPDLLTRLLRFVPPAALAALILPPIFIQDNAYAISLFNDRIPAALVAAIIAVLTKNTFLTIFSGMGALWCYHLFL